MDVDDCNDGDKNSQRKNTLYEEDYIMNLEQSLNELESNMLMKEENDRKAFDIVVKNAITSLKTKLYVTPANTLGQVFESTAEELGFNVEKSNNIYVNENTSQSATDPTITLREFQVEEDTVISIEQDGNVAAVL